MNVDAPGDQVCQEETGSAGMQPAAPVTASKMEPGASHRSLTQRSCLRESPHGDRPTAGRRAGSMHSSRGRRDLLER